MDGITILEGEIIGNHNDKYTALQIVNVSFPFIILSRAILTQMEKSIEL